MEKLEVIVTCTGCNGDCDNEECPARPPECACEDCDCDTGADIGGEG